ncbi:MAG: glycosyl hydrolase family 65 protein, partial [Halanaerobiales bacterium]
FFIQAVRLDLDNFNENTYKDIHLSCMGSAWMVLVQGFAGMRNYNGHLHFNPYLPEKWENYQFHIKFRGSKLRIRVDKDQVFYQLISGEVLKIIHKGEEISVDQVGIRIK